MSKRRASKHVSPRKLNFFYLINATALWGHANVHHPRVLLELRANIQPSRSMQQANRKQQNSNTTQLLASIFPSTWSVMIQYWYSIRSANWPRSAVPKRNAHRTFFFLLQLLGLHKKFAVHYSREFFDHCADVIFASQTNKCSDVCGWYGLVRRRI